MVGATKISIYTYGNAAQKISNCLSHSSQVAELDLNPDTPVPGVAVAEGEAGECDSRVCVAVWLCVHGLNVVNRAGILFCFHSRRPLISVENIRLE